MVSFKQKGLLLLEQPFFNFAKVETFVPLTGVEPK